jgi:IS30 family transposase
MVLEMVNVVESTLCKEWSTERISVWLLEECSPLISYETICRHVWNDRRSSGILYIYLHREGKRYQSRGKKQAGRGCIKNRVSIIDERPAIVDDKSRIEDGD